MTQNTNIDDLLAEVRAAAESMRIESAETRAPANLEARPELPESPEVEPVAAVQPRREVWLDELLVLDDADFLQEAYRVLLHRNADESGLQRYSALLAEGGSRVEVILALNTSSEGRSTGTRVVGLARRRLLLKLYRLTLGKLPMLRALATAEGRTSTREGLWSSLRDVRRFQARHVEEHRRLRAWQQRQAQSLELELFGLKQALLRQSSDLLRLQQSISTDRIAMRDALATTSGHLDSLRIKADNAETSQAETARELESIRDALESQIESIDAKLSSVETTTVSNQQVTAELSARLEDDGTRLSSLEERSQALDGVDKEVATLARRFPDLGRRITYQSRIQEDLEKRIDVLEADGTEIQRPAPAPEAPAASDSALEAYYVAFEDECRGTREQIRENLSVYLPFLRSLSASCEECRLVVDLGCGRGEWLELVAEKGFQTKGVDLNPVMVADCQSAGLDVDEADVIRFLEGLPASSVLLITSFHVIEHLPFASLYRLLEECARVLVPGGGILFETPNPENVLVGSHTFYHDPTHRNPITPTSIEFLAAYHGFGDTQIMRLHPYPESAKVPGSDPLTERVNGHLCGPQDFAILARIGSAQSEASDNQ